MINRDVAWRGCLYRLTMRIAHKFNWHYAPPAPPVYIDNDTDELWCKWCGLRATIKHSNLKNSNLKNSIYNVISTGDVCKEGTVLSEARAGIAFEPKQN